MQISRSWSLRAAESDGDDSPSKLGTKGCEKCPYRSGTESVWSCEWSCVRGCVVVAAVGSSSSRLGDKAATYASMRKGVRLHASKQVCGHSARRRQHAVEDDLEGSSEFLGWQRGRRQETDQGGPGGIPRNMGGLENGGWGGREQSEGAEREKSRRCVDEWAEAGWRLG